MRTVVGTTITVAIVLLVVKLAIAPVHGVRNVAACERAYAKATSRTDSISVDMLSFPDSTNRLVSRRCGELRTR